jgi:rfaE bifunctional protein nucleotidyltransferase chain/domain
MQIYPAEKIMTLSEAERWRWRLREDQKKLVLTNGCFDILHRGHTEYLYKARQYGDALIVLMNSDASVRSLKGSGRPVNDQYSRAFVLSSLYFIDAVTVFGDSDCSSLISVIKPDIYTKGADYSLDTINSDEKNALMKVGADIKFIEFTDGFSTTATIENMKISGGENE